MNRGLMIWLLCALAAPVAAIPVDDFFRDAEFKEVTLSPRGDYFTVAVPRGDRTYLVVMRTRDKKIVSSWDFGSNRHAESVRWVGDERFFVTVTRKTGSFDVPVIENFDVYASNVDGKRRRQIPDANKYQFVSLLPEDPDHVLVQRSIDNAFLFKLNVWNGETTVVASAPVRRGSFVVDFAGRPRYVIGSEADNSTVILRREEDGWKEVQRAPFGADVRLPIGFAADGQRVYFTESADGGPPAIVLVDPESGVREEVLPAKRVEPSGYLRSSDQRHLLAVYYEDGLPAYEWVDEDHPESKIYAGLINAFPDRAVFFGGVSRDGRFILVLTFSDRDPGRYYLFDRENGTATYLLASRPWIDPKRMSPKRPIEYRARDGTLVHGYLTLPEGSSGRNLPLILHPHGGPHGVRDSWGFDPIVQFLASRGYAVLQVNFRGSGGYGMGFLRQGFRNWGTSMIDDMNDGVRWAIEQGIADPNRICTFGASYGGYAALQVLVREPELYRCAIGYVGVYSLPLMFRDGDIPRSEEGRDYLRRVLPEDRAEQERQSPVFNVERIRVPVMLVHGEKDQRVPMSQFRALKEALTRVGRPPEREVLAAKEGHGFYDLENNRRLYTELEAFLARHIGHSATAPTR